jgi:SMC interacting uncharacterized protein involved in chromosome segregation
MSVINDAMIRISQLEKVFSEHARDGGYNWGHNNHGYISESIRTEIKMLRQRIRICIKQERSEQLELQRHLGKLEDE